MKRLILITYILFAFQFLHSGLVNAVVLERVVAIVNDDIILLSEFEAAVHSKKKPGSRISRQEVLDEMINRLLLLEEAKKFWIGNARSLKTEADKSDTIDEYIERKIKVFIHIPYEDILYYYRLNPDLYKGRELYDVRGEIEAYLIENELSIKLHEYIEELMAKAYIRIQLTNRAGQ